MKRRNIIKYVHYSHPVAECDPRVLRMGTLTAKWLDVTCPKCLARGAR